MKRLWLSTAVFAVIGSPVYADIQNTTPSQGNFRSYEESPFQEFQSTGGPGTIVCFQNGTSVYRQQLSSAPDFGSTAFGDSSSSSSGALISAKGPRGTVQLMLEGGTLCVFE